MHRFTNLAAACCVLAVVVTIPSTASGARSDWFDPYEVRYIEKYERAHHAGHYLGANIVDDYNPSRAHVLTDSAEFTAMLHPPVIEEVEPAYSEPTTYSASVASGSCPAYMAGEASSPDAINPASGAEGCFQVIPSTAAAMGAACADVNAPSCVAAICAAQGNDAWDAADPC